MLGIACSIYFSIFEHLLVILLPKLVQADDESFCTKACFTVLSAIGSDANAILSLCVSGFDVQARSLLRGLGEKLDLFVLVYTDEIVARDYVENSTFEGSKQFFFDRISKGKLRRLAITRVRQLVPNENMNDVFDWLYNEWRKELELMLGAAVHPNHTVAMLSLFPNLPRGKSEVIGLYGHPTNASLRTLQEALRLTLPLALAAQEGGLFPIREEQGGSEDSDHRLKIEKLARFGLCLCLTGWLDRKMVSQIKAA